MKYSNLILFFLLSCGSVQKSQKGEQEPFEIVITSFDYSSAYTLQYVLTNDDIKVIFLGEIEGEADSLLFSSTVGKNEKLDFISKIELDDLHSYYENPCMDDGSQISIEFSRESKVKQMHLSNFYHQDIGQIIEIINGFIPKKLRIWYDRDRLIAKKIDCENAQNN